MKEQQIINSAVSEPLDKLIQDEHLRIILNELLQMKPPGRDVLIMRHLEQRSYSDIASALGKKENYIRSVASKSLTKLRENLNGQLDIDP
jgi:RNA polymerase sigma factor (sigma-70 family)